MEHNQEYKILRWKYVKSFFVVQNFNIALNKVDFIGAISFGATDESVTKSLWLQ